MLRAFTLVWFAVLIVLTSLLLFRLSALGELTPLLSAFTGKATPTHLLHPRSTATVTPTPAGLRPDFQTGVVFPQWGPDAYSTHDRNWVSGLSEISSQTAARWLSLPITFHQVDEFATTVELQKDIPSPATLASGIKMAHARGYHVFVYPLLTIDGVHSWAGYIQFSSIEQATAWFDSYWHALQPYVLACEQVGAEQFSIGNELEQLESSFSDLWRQLISNIHESYHGRIVYSINWSSLKYPIPDWFSDPDLSEVGVSTYFSLSDLPQHLDPATLSGLWQERVGTELDALATALGKPIFISEIGYRNTNNAGYLPYAENIGTDELRDDAQQAALYNAALQNVSTDESIDGIFFWAWSLSPFAPNQKPAARTLFNWFSRL
jgi:hypothetical protein